MAQLHNQLYALLFPFNSTKSLLRDKLVRGLLLVRMNRGTFQQLLSNRGFSGGGGAPQARTVVTVLV